ncbi:MAG: hypothetical protein DHS20C21_03230 [Gemmatimonadota bacterium]|nr:MAG: hypothetical protein DHS20C21_03230 [Gemmatimonadota bacterium]
METLSTAEVRRLALTRAGLLNPAWTGLPQRARGSGKQARRATQAVVERFGYLQVDTVSIAGARSHTIVLLSRLPGLRYTLGEELLQPGQPLFEYWGHEASWMPLDVYPHFEFRRRAFREHPWWGDIVGAHPKEAADLLKRIRDDGPIRSLDMEGRGSRGWWDLKLAKKVATALWSSGELSIRERKNFQRSYDLTERVIPADVLSRTVSYEQALDSLLLRALEGHGWATTGTLARTWRLRNRAADLAAALQRLEDNGDVLPCRLVPADGRAQPGWIRPADLELAARLRRARPARDQGVLLSPFDPVLWERDRVRTLFGFDQVLEIFKPAATRVYGYYCLPVLAGERLVARMDLKADRAAGELRVLSIRFEGTGTARPAEAVDGEAARSALDRYASAVELKPVGWNG